MIERVEIFGVAASLVATAHVRIPGDEEVEVPLKIGHDDFGRPYLEMDLEPVACAVRERQAQ